MGFDLLAPSFGAGGHWRGLGRSASGELMLEDDLRSEIRNYQEAQADLRKWKFLGSVAALGIGPLKRRWQGGADRDAADRDEEEQRPAAVVRCDTFGLAAVGSGIAGVLVFAAMCVYHWKAHRLVNEGARFSIRLPIRLRNREARVAIRHAAARPKEPPQARPREDAPA
jgi:hypothetical protein